ncbi:MAG: DUF1553 domain-containing protein [Planctomycetaceae bacterium]|nr:DUF1553 domain-containing protein [Planctomycetaceae bacterium]
MRLRLPPRRRERPVDLRFPRPAPIRHPREHQSAFDPPSDAAPPGSRRELAAWLTDPRHPLTARVWVNRLWQYHFGRGLVEHTGDFGLAGERPTHPELLDWLAAELVESGWSTKHIQRLIVTSATFQQASTVDARCRDIDPENRWLWHWQPRRLEQEVLRDAMLAVSGELDPAVGGASVPLEEREQSLRRSLYLFQQRGVPPEMQRLFDGPAEAGESCARRHTSTTALQSLYLFNDRFVLDRAIRLAETLQQEAGGSVPRQIRLACLRSLGREPNGEELQAAVEFVNRVASEDATTVAAVSAEPADGQPPPHIRLSPLALFCQVLLNLNEFAYLE